MKQEEVRRNVNKLLDSIAGNGYSAHIVVTKGQELVTIVGVGDLESIANGYATMFSDATKEGSSDELKYVCAFISDVVAEFQAAGLEKLFGISGEDGEECIKISNTSLN